MLDERLKAYAQTDMYPFHMPGHKRSALDDWNPYRTDITEIDGFDNLHDAQGVLRDAQEKAARVYGSKSCCYLVNGSTCGILAAISAAVAKHGKIMVARNCHKAVYNGILLRELDASYVYPVSTTVGIQGQIRPEDIKQLLEVNPDTEAVLVTSPTYDGVVSDIAGIAQVAHNHGIPLIVDAAHGAHLGFTEEFPENPIRLGADIVIESVHKTLPAFTQTALLHICSNRVSEAKVKRYLGIYETSSPSYVLMAGIERCVDYMEARGREDLQQLAARLAVFHKRVADLENIHVITKEDLTEEEAYDFDASKILIFSKSARVTGTILHEVLLEKYHLQMEMVSGQYVLALTSVMDSEEGFARLAEALCEMDRELFSNEEGEAQSLDSAGLCDGGIAAIYRRQKLRYSIYEAEDMPRREVPFAEAVGKAAGEFIYLYPPGIPVIVPGEEITGELIRDLQECQRSGLSTLGLTSENRMIILEE